MDLGPTIPAGISFEHFATNLSALTCPRAHTAAIPVDELLTGAIVAWLCPDCDKQLPADWKAGPPPLPPFEPDPRLTQHIKE